MRLGVVNGNGCICTKCGSKLIPSEAIKVKVQKLSDNPLEASTGMYKSLGKMDLCLGCYTKMIKFYIEKPRKIYKKGGGI